MCQTSSFKGERDWTVLNLLESSKKKISSSQRKMFSPTKICASAAKKDREKKESTRLNVICDNILKRAMHCSLRDLCLPRVLLLSQMTNNEDGLSFSHH